MGKPLTIKESDDIRLIELKNSLGARSKVEVLRRGLDLLEKEILKKQRVKRWSKAAKAVANQSSEILQEFNLNKNRFDNL